MAAIPVISCFTGGGLLDLGFERAGFNSIWTNEVNPVYADLYEYGMSAWRRAEGRSPASVKVSCRDSIEEVTAKRIRGEAVGGSPDIYGVIGGPPCPDFSRGGIHGGHTGPHGRLTQCFADLICDLKPDFFVMENVAGLMRIQQHRQFLQKILRQFEHLGGYAVDAAVLNALELGVPQDRERLFVIGLRDSLVRDRLGGTVACGDHGWFVWPRNEQYAKAKQLPWPAACRYGGIPEKPLGIPLELTVYPVLTGPPDPESLPNGLEYFKPYSPKFWSRDEGDVSTKSFKRLHRYRYSPTAWYGNQEVHLHPWKPRRLSVREALRIQTVPDSYVLPTEASLSAKFRLICNGVPCLMAQSIAGALSVVLRGASLAIRQRDPVLFA